MFSVKEMADIKSKSYKIEQSGTLPNEVLQLIYDKKLFKLFAAKEIGGLQLELADGLKVFRNASAIDGSLGWLVTIGTGGNMFIPLMEQDVCKNLMGQDDSVIAGSGFPSGTAIKKNGGYVVSGEWKYCSGSDFATIFTANCFIEKDGIRTNEIISCILKPEQVEVMKDWDAFGLKGTGSHSIKVNDAWVDDSYTFRLGEAKNKFGSSVHTFPFMAFSEASFVSVCLGIGSDFYEEAKLSIERKKDHLSPKRYDELKNLLNDTYHLFQQLEKSFYTQLEQLWAKHKQGEELTEQELNGFSQLSKVTVQKTIDDVDKLIRYLGMEAIMESSALNRNWRNLYTAGQHAFITP